MGNCFGKKEKPCINIEDNDIQIDCISSCCYRKGKEKQDTNIVIKKNHVHKVNQEEIPKKTLKNS